jgi:6-phosphofructokinase 1
MRPSNLADSFGKRDSVDTPLKKKYEGSSFTEGFLDENSTMIETIWRDNTMIRSQFKRFLRAGPHTKLYFEPSQVHAAIVTCGGLCPGLNNVIRGITQMLSEYGVTKIWGVRNGYMGICDPKAWVELNMKVVETIHQQGGSFLVANRGNDEPKKMAAELIRRGVNQIYVIGGDGSHRGAAALQTELDLANYQCAVCAIPKTIDNDIPCIDVSFGFGSAVAEATKAIQAAYVEASGAPNGIGLVKLMGRSSGFVVLYAVLASALVDVALLPEMEDIHMPKLLNFIKQKIAMKGRCVIVVAEGCGKTLMDIDPSKKDAGGNLKLPDVGLFLRDKINEYSKQNKENWTLKYIDPTYMIRAVPANPYDSVYCHVLAHNAVHSAMAGYTGVSIGRVDQHYVMIPIKLIAESPPRQVNIAGRWFARLRMTTEQTDFAPPGKVVRQSSFVLNR